MAAGLLASIYLAGLAYLYTHQRSFIYPAPELSSSMPSGFKPVAYRTSDDVIIRAAYRPARQGMPTVVFFHGNGDRVSGSVAATKAYVAAGYGLLLPEYRGYGGTPGSPSEAGLNADGRGARGWLVEQGVPMERQVLIGMSLGTGVATQLAAEAKPAALVLISPFTSLPDAVAYRFKGMIPAEWMVLDRFESKAKIGRVFAPVLILHDREDRSIPVAQGQRLAALAPGAKLLLFSGHGHQLGFASEAQAAGVAWLAGLGL